MLLWISDNQMLNQNRLFLLFIPVFLASCALSTPYKSFDMKFPAGGYTEEKRGEQNYYITFSGNGHSKAEEVNTFWNRRANELCPNGFKLISRNSQIFHADVKEQGEIYIGYVGVPVPVTVSIDVPYAEGEIECLQAKNS